MALPEVVITPEGTNTALELSDQQKAAMALIEDSRNIAKEYEDTYGEVFYSQIWVNVDVYSFLGNLERNILNSSCPNQGEGTNFCGPSALLSKLIETDPEGYVDYMLSLYLSGIATYGSGDDAVTHDVLGESNLQKAAGTLGQKGLSGNPADQIFFLTMAQNYNSSYLNIDKKYHEGDEKDPTWSGTTLGEFEQMMTDFGFDVEVWGSDLAVEWSVDKGGKF